MEESIEKIIFDLQNEISDGTNKIKVIKQASPYVE